MKEEKIANDNIHSQFYYSIIFADISILSIRNMHISICEPG